MSNDNVDMIESQNANNIKNSENLNQAKGKFLFGDLFWRLKFEIVLLLILSDFENI